MLPSSIRKSCVFFTGAKIGRVYAGRFLPSPTSSTICLRIRNAGNLFLCGRTLSRGFGGGGRRGKGEGRGNGETEGGGTPPAPFNLRGNIFGERWPSWVFYKVVTQVPLIFILAATFWQSALRENIVPPVLSPESFARGGGGILPRLPRCLQCRLYPDQEFHILKVRNLLYSLPWKQGTSSCWLPSMEETRECETKGYKDGPRFSRIRYFLLRATKFLLFAILPTFSRRQFQGRSN